MIEKIKATNPYSGQSEMLTPEEHKLYIKIKEAEFDEDDNGTIDIIAYDFNQDGEWDKFKEVS